MEFNIEKFTLISSDKAVRPTSIMGASKRVSELIVERFSNKISNTKEDPCQRKTVFSTVRFGNVLNSSGSVIPLFQNQIAKGGPITITHPEITRYFMTIPEAIELVLQSSSISKGGEIFLLDMGESIKILDLAKQLINLSGYKVKDKYNDGDIEITYTGLRPGEKLYEELSIENKLYKTKHPKIFSIKEKFISKKKIFDLIKNFTEEGSSSDIKFVKEIISTTVKDYNPDTKLVKTLKENII